MAEGANIEIAHHLHERAMESGSEEERRAVTILEIIEAIVLAVVAILTAWSGYQAARWDGRNALYYGEANKDRVTSTQLSTRGGQVQLFDATTFNTLAQAYSAGNTKLVAFYERRFSPEYRIAYDAWVKTDPLHNPKAPPGPASMPQYHNPLLDQAAALNDQASALFEQGTAARETGDDYVRTTVLLATVLFLVALSQRFKTSRVRIALLVLSFVIVAGCVVGIATRPIA